VLWVRLGEITVRAGSMMHICDSDASTLSDAIQVRPLDLVVTSDTSRQDWYSERSSYLLNIVLADRLGRTIDCVLLHLLGHVGVLDDCFSLFRHG